MSWVYVAVGIACLIVLQMLRSALSVVFPRYGARPIREPDATAFGGVDLIDAKTEALAALGFAGPAWIGENPESAAVNGVVAHAAYRNKDQHIVAWVGPTLEVAMPNQLLTYYTTLLTDGRYAVTQVSDPYFDLVEDPMTPAQTIPASDPATELAAHREFVRKLGVPPANSTPQEDVLRFAGEHMNSIRSRLLERGLIRESAGVARPTLGFALRLLKGAVTRPKTADVSQDVPTSRLPYLAGAVERSKERAPSQGMQWFLMLVSAFLFVGIGWPLFGLDFTLVLLAVIAFHEGGHWLAMRMFGYGNPHITLLPLLGGVTIGHENDPNAAHRAWVALAGPLPGIILGWVLLGTMFTGNAQLSFDGLALTGVIVLLFVNYLNVLPIPPLDGHHIVQAILPAQGAVLQIILIVIGVAAAVYVAWLLDFWPIALIAGLQLLGIRSLWRTSRIVATFSKQPLPHGADRDTHRAWIFEALDEKLGKPQIAAKRIGLANDVLNQLELSPMGGGQRTLVTIVYGALLVVPVAALLVSAMVPWDLYEEDNPEIAAIYEELDADYDGRVDEAKTLDVSTLVADLAEGQPVIEPTDDATLEELRARIGTLPPDLEAFYRARDGQLEGIGIGPAAEVRRVDPALFVTGDLQYSVWDGEIYFWQQDLGDVTIPRSATTRWWQLGYDEAWANYVFFDPDGAPGEPSIFVLGVDESGAYGTIGDVLRDHWALKRHWELEEANNERILAVREEQVRDMTVTELLDEFPEPSLLVRLITGELWGRGPASDEEVAELAARIGRPLPEDLVEAWSVTNGHDMSGLLPTTSVAPASAAQSFSAERAVELANESGLDSFSLDALADCWVVGGNEYPDEDGTPELYAMLFWCPEEPRAHRYIDLSSAETADSFTTVLRRAASRMTFY